MNRYEIVQYPSGQTLLVETIAENGQRELQRVVEIFTNPVEAQIRLERMRRLEAEAIAVG